MKKEYIYIYIERERERERENTSGTVDARVSLLRNTGECTTNQSI